MPCDNDEHVPLLSGQHPPHAEILPAKTLAIRYISALIFVFGVGVVAWWVSHDMQETDGLKTPEKGDGWLTQVLGWSSAALYVRASLFVPFQDLISDID